MFENIFNNVSKKHPLVHCVTNYVTVNDCANILLAAGAAPIMADEIGEVKEITAICNALAINIGTLNERTINSMVVAGKEATRLRHPVILDPVGAGASALRTNTTFRLMNEINFTVIRGNISEIKTISKGTGTTRGVDADVSDAVTEANLNEAVRFVKEISRQKNAVIAVTGAIDIVADSDKAYIIRNGHPMMSRITGTGCMLTALIAAYCGANTENTLDAVAASVAAMGICGEIAYEKTVGENGGTGTFRIRLIDAMSNLDAETFWKRIKVEIR
jgi:hydroxyethylthiazole kinase